MGSLFCDYSNRLIRPTETGNLRRAGETRRKRGSVQRRGNVKCQEPVNQKGQRAAPALGLCLVKPIQTSRGRLLQPAEQSNRILSAIATDHMICLKRGANSRPLWIAEQPTQIALGKMQAALTGRLAERHAGNRRTDRWSNTTGTATGTAIHFNHPK